MAQLRLGEVGVSKELRCVEIVDVNDLSHEASPFWRFFSIIKKIFENGNCSSAQRGAFFCDRFRLPSHGILWRGG